jgi:hypothetical protein
MTYKEYGLWLERHIADCPYGEGGAMLKMCLHNFKDCKPAPEVEPLACLADRKGINKMEIYSPTKEDRLWYIFWYNFDEGTHIDQTPITGSTYAAAEAQAREWLLKLEDRGGKE